MWVGGTDSEADIDVNLQNHGEAPTQTGMLKGDSRRYSHF